MTIKFLKVVLNRYSNPFEILSYTFCGKQNKYLNCRTFTVCKVLSDSQKFTLKLLSEVDEKLEKGELKHREHPGLRKLKAVALPEILSSSVDKILSDESEKTLLSKAEDLCKTLKSRRLPMEETEVESRISSMIPSHYGNIENLSEILTKHQLRIMKKRIYTEMARWKPIEYNAQQCLAYLVGRLAPNYASTSHVFQELKDKITSFKPTTYFDFGSGVGSSLWAAHSHWGDTIKEYFCVDTSADMNELNESILTDQETQEKYIKPVFFRQFLPASENRKYDLVVSAFSMLDLPSSLERLRVIDTLWRKTKDVLVIIEYGTTAGFHCVLDARDFILHVENDSAPEFAYYSSGAYIISPCPHEYPCPKFLEKQNSTCGFIVPYQVKFPKRLSHTTDKDWISYVILKKGQRPEESKPLPRVVKPVLKKARHLYCTLCCPDGELHRVVVTKAKHGRNAYRCARKCHQGDVLPVELLPEDLLMDTSLDVNKPEDQSPVEK